MVGVVAGLAAVAAPALGGAAAAATSAAVAGSGAVVLEGASLGATVVALGEGALVGTGAVFGGSTTGIALAALAGPIGCLFVGCDRNESDKGNAGYTWDCWKPVVRDTSTHPSSGMTLRRLAAHPNVRSVSLDDGGLLVDNTFGERFRLTLVRVEETLAFHASIYLSEGIRFLGETQVIH